MITIRQPSTVGWNLLVVLLLASPQLVAAPKGRRPSLPNTKAGQCATAFFRAFNSGDVNEVRKFESKYRAKSALKQRSIDERLELYRQLRDDWGDLEVDGVFESTPLEISIGVNSLDSGNFLRCRFELEEQEPHGLLAIHIQGGGPRPTKVERVRARPLDARGRKEVINTIARILEGAYVYPELGIKMAKTLQENLSKGAYDDIKNSEKLAVVLTSDLREICKDKHLAVNAGHFPSEAFGERDQDDGWWAKSRSRNYGFEKVERLAGNIGYLKFDQFHPSEESQAIAAAAMTFLANTDALIFDLRENGGGSPEMIAYLSGYLFDESVHLNSFYNRKEDKRTETWSRTDVAGSKFGSTKPVYVLTSRYTFSGAEEFTYNLKNLKRATIVGKTTGGGAHPVYRERVNDSFVVNVPYARAINPITKTNWERVGVTPDIDVPADRALLVAQKHALERMLESDMSDEPSREIKAALRRVTRKLRDEN